MKKALTAGSDKKDNKDKPGDKVKDKQGDKSDAKDKKGDAKLSLDDYLQALSVLDTDGASKEDKDKAQKVKDKFESQ
jgi:hypothetical protein